MKCETKNNSEKDWDFNKILQDRDINILSLKGDMKKQEAHSEKEKEEWKQLHKDEMKK